MGKQLGVRNEPTEELIEALAAITDARLRVREARDEFDQAVLHGREVGATWGQLEAARLGLANPEHVTEGQVGSTSPARQIIARLERDKPKSKRKSKKR